MSRMSVDVQIQDSTRIFSQRLRREMMGAMTDVVLDLKRVASASAPHDTGFLDRNAQHSVEVGSSYVEGTVGFSAFNKGFDYARWTHDSDYNLGKKSTRKRGGKSRYGGATVPVGKGYLENALNMNKTSYLQYLEDTYHNALR